MRKDQIIGEYVSPEATEIVIECQSLMVSSIEDSTESTTPVQWSK